MPPILYFIRSFYPVLIPYLAVFTGREVQRFETAEGAEREYVSVCKRTTELNLPLEKVFPFPAKI